MSIEKSNLFNATARPAPGQPELVERIADGAGVRIERIVSRGHSSPPGFWYDQREAEWVMVVAGRARLRFGDGATLELVAGDYTTIPAHTRHRVDWTAPDEDTIWLAVFF
jgi:cupin 2 domain-containing protein